MKFTKIESIFLLFVILGNWLIASFVMEYLRDYINLVIKPNFYTFGRGVYAGIYIANANIVNQAMIVMLSCLIFFDL